MTYNLTSDKAQPKMTSMQRPSKTTCLIIPVLKTTSDYEKKLAHYNSLNLPIIIVHDKHIAFSDQSSSRSKPRWILVAFNKWRGKGAALEIGLRVAMEQGYTMALTIDCCEPVDLNELYKIIQKAPQTQTITIGTRSEEKLLGHTDKRRLMHFSNFLFWLETGLTCSDTRSSIRLYPVPLMNKLRIRFHRRAWEVEALVRAIWSGLKLNTIELKSYQVLDEPTPVRKFDDYVRMIGIHTYLIIRRLWVWPFKQLVEHQHIDWPKGWKNKLAFLWKRYFWKTKQKPSEVALAVAIGLFSGLLPLIGAQSLIAIYLAQRLHLNKILVLIFSLISLTPLMPFIVYIDMRIGHGWLIGDWYAPVQWSNLTWDIIKTSMKELLIGGTFTAVVLAIVVGFFTYGYINLLRRNKYKQIKLLRNNFKQYQKVIGQRNRVSLVVASILIVIMLGSVHWGIACWLAPSPASNALPASISKQIKNKTYEQTNRLGDCILFERDGLKASSLEGPDQVQGAARALFYDQERALLNRTIKDLRHLVNQHPIKQYIIDRKSWLANERWLRYLSKSTQEELTGLSRIVAGLGLFQSMAFNRLLVWQLSYDLLKRSNHSDWLQGTAFGLVGKWQNKKRVWLAHNVDFQKHHHLETLKTIMLITPAEGYRYMSIGLPDQLGVVTGMNEKGLGVALVSSTTKRRTNLGMPAPLLAKEIMVQAASLIEAIDMIKSTTLVGAESFLIGSGSENKIVVVEKNGEQSKVRSMLSGAVLATNHFQSLELSEQERLFQSQNISSQARLTRLKELIYIHKDKMSVARIAKILRDRRTLYGRKLGDGHGFAINRFNTLHSVIFDLKKKIAWVGSSPFHLGAYIPFELNNFVEVSEQPIIPPDSMILTGKYKSYEIYQLGLKEAKRLVAEGIYQEALAWIQEIHPINPRDYKLYLLAAQALEKLGRYDEAAYNYQQSKNRRPETIEEKKLIEKKIKSLKM